MGSRLRIWLALGASALAGGHAAAQQPAVALEQLAQLKEPGLVGLLELPWLYPENGAAPEAVPAHARPDPSSPTLAILDPQGMRSTAGEPQCRWMRDLDRQAGDREVCEFVEAGYEEPAVPVFELFEGSGERRYRVALTTRTFGWIRSDHRFHPLMDLLAGGERLTYLDLRRWDRRLFDEPGGSQTRLEHPALRGEREVPYESLGYAIRQGRLWLRVKVLDQVCGGTDPAEIGRGWVPAKTPAGEPQAWFWSRGC